MGEVEWRTQRYKRDAYVLGERVGMVSGTGDGWSARYRGKHVWSIDTALTIPGSHIGVFLSVDEAVAAVEERHVGREACE